MGALLVGCGTGRTPPAGLALQTAPPAWSVTAGTGATAAAAAATPLVDWWRRFDDPLLADLVGQALRANTSVRGAQAALTQSRAQVDVAAAGLSPRLSGSATAQRSRSGAAGTGNNFQAGFDASWETDLAGGTHAGVAAAQADAQASVFSLADVQVSLAAEVAVDYLQLRGTQWRLAIASANAASLADSLQITDWRVQAGLLTGLELAQARTALAQAQAQLPALRSSADQLAHALAVLTGEPPLALMARLQAPVPDSSASPAQAASAAAALRPPPDDLVLAIPADTLRQRPDVRAAEARITAAVQRVAQADAARFPSLRLSGSLGLNAARLLSLGNGASLVAAVLGSLSVPIADGGAARAQVRAQQAALVAAGTAYDAAVLAALQAVEDSLSAMGGQRQRLASLRAAADTARQAAGLADQRYRSGLVDYAVLLETQRTALNTQDALASTLTDLNTEQVRLYKALGGGWTPDPQALGDAAPAAATRGPTASLTAVAAPR